MQQNLYKTLSVVKDLITLEDWETLDLMAGRLRQSDNAQPMQFLARAIENQRWDDALLLIDDFEKQGRQLAKVHDPIVASLKVELHFQENELHLLRADRDEQAKTIEMFQIRYHNRLGDLIDRVLYLRMEKLRIQAISNPLLQSAYEAAVSAYEQYHDAHNSEIAGMLYNLSEEEQRKIKILYRKACLICHPDRVTEDKEEEARAMFEELHEAYLYNDIKKVRLIAELLEKTGKFEPRANQLEEADALRARIELVMVQIEEVREEIDRIERSEAMNTVKRAGDDWNAYFAELAENLETQIDELQKWHLLHAAQN